MEGGARRPAAGGGGDGADIGGKFAVTSQTLHVSEVVQRVRVSVSCWSGDVKCKAIRSILASLSAIGAQRSELAMAEPEGRWWDRRVLPFLALHFTPGLCSHSHRHNHKQSLRNTSRNKLQRCKLAIWARPNDLLDSPSSGHHKTNN